MFIRKIYNKFPTGEYEDWELYRRLFPYIKAAMS